MAAQPRARCEVSAGRETIASICRRLVYFSCEERVPGKFRYQLYFGKRQLDMNKTVAQIGLQHLDVVRTQRRTSSKHDPAFHDDVLCL